MVNPCEKPPQPAPLGPLRRLMADESAATSLEWALLLAAIALPGYFILKTTLNVLVGHYQMMTMLNSLPFP